MMHVSIANQLTVKRRLLERSRLTVKPEYWHAQQRRLRIIPQDKAGRITSLWNDVICNVDAVGGFWPSER